MDNRSPVFRFGITTDGRRSSYWRVRAGMKQPELFLEREGHGKRWHFSLHASGQWHMRERRKERLTWARPAEVIPGCTRAVGIVQPVAVVHREDPAPEDVVLVPVAPDAEPTTFSLFIERPGANLSGLPGKNADGAAFVGRVPLAAGAGTCCVLGVQEPLQAGRVELPRPDDEELRQMREWAANGVLVTTIVGELSDGAVALIDLRADTSVTYPVLLEHCREHRPDGVVYDATNWPARLVARQLGIRTVRTVPNLAENQAYSQVDEAVTAGLGDDPQMAALADDVARFAAAHGVDLDVAGTWDVTEDLNLVFVPRAFQPAGDTFDDSFRFVGAMIGEREQRQSWTSPHPELPLLFISLGSIFTDNPGFYRTCLEAFGDGRFQVAMTIGGVDPGDVGPLPPTVQVQPWFPQLAVLRQSAGFITHAGMNSTMEALYYGVPMLTLPQMPEQAVNADRVAALGLGRPLNRQAVTADALRAAVDDVIADPVIRTNLDRMRAEIHRAGGVSAGAQAIEEYLAK